ncbi:MAG TPA: Gfo/Idh/MocA family oxidoreductase [Pyrinomonadaceae bacterium]|nr:Gfo/Idh/MocA family oxidoreductase [Pyrinomonadaceae bacterium]
MSRKIKWGILGAANIAVKKVIPAMQKGGFCEITAIASRHLEKAKAASANLNIPKIYGSYEDLLNDSEIEAIYIPLPNHLHLKWSIKAAEAGKHVLCEKPIALNSDEVKKLIEVRNQTGVKIQEAFMVRHHPQWLKIRELINAGKIGKIQSITGFFSYNIPDPANVRNHVDWGGGCLLDIGSYCINLSRFVLETEPKRVSGLIERDSETGIDKLTSAILDFPNAQATFTVGARLVSFQRMQFLGDKGRLEVQIPFNIPPDTLTRIFIDDGSDLYRQNLETIEFSAVDQYTLQGDEFSKAILDETEQAISLEDSFKNMAVIDAVFRSAESGYWEVPNKL